MAESAEIAFEEIANLQIVENVQDIEEGARLESLDAHWIKLNPELHLWRFIYQLPEGKEPLPAKMRFHPILLIHGYRSSHVTWNWMVQHLWWLGFRNIFGMELFDYKLGLHKNAEHLEKVVEEVTHLTQGFERVDIIGHSMGGIVARYYAKYFEGRGRLRLLATLGSAHEGLALGFSLLTLVDRASEARHDLSSRKDGVLAEMNKQMTADDVYKITMVNIGGSLLRYRGTDGFVRPIILSDMVNVTVPSSHSNLNKTDASFYILDRLLAQKDWVLKLRLLSVETFKNFAKSRNLRLSMQIRWKGRKQYYPTSQSFPLNPLQQPLLPKEPIILFEDVIPQGQQIILELRLHEKQRLGNKRLATTRYILRKEGMTPHPDQMILEKPNYIRLYLACYMYHLQYEE